jgi:hypothetical protein
MAERRLAAELMKI